MATLGISAEISEFINGIPIPSSTNWNDVEILGSFDNATNQNISIERLEFIGDAYNIIKSYIDAGNIFEGLDYRFEIYNNSELQQYEFWIDLTQDAIENPERGSYEVKAVLKNGLDQLNDRLQAITYGFLESEGKITDADYIDIDYVVQKVFEPLEIIISTFIIYTLAAALIERIKDFGINASNSSTKNPVLAAIFTGLALIIEAAYAFSIAVALVRLVGDTLGYLIQPKRTHKAIYLKTLLEKAAIELGYGFETDIPELDNIIYLPSNRNVDEPDPNGFISFTSVGSIKKGIPNDNDFGYVASEAYEIAVNMFNAQYQVVDNVLQFRSRNSDYWVRQSTFIMPSTLIERVVRNASELIANRVIKFRTDIRDIYTEQNFKGTNYEVITDLITVNNPTAKFVKGLEEISINCALGNRKDKLTPLERILQGLASIADNAISVLGGDSKLVNAVKTRVGTLKVSDNNHTVPKLLWIEGGELPVDHRDKLNARVLENEYWAFESFVRQNRIGQRVIFLDIPIPFGFVSFLNVSQNSYFRDLEGRTGRIRTFRWLSAQDSADVTYDLQIPYTDNLEEKFIEPD